MQNAVLPPDRPFQNRNGGQLSLPPYLERLFDHLNLGRNWIWTTAEALATFST